MDRASEIYYQPGSRICFATKHGKEEVVGPLFSAKGLQVEAAPIDTDQFGTFSGEIERKGSIRETLRKKVREAAKALPRERLLLASEGSFGPDPILGFTRSGLESLLLFDRELGLEIYAEHLDLSPVHSERILGPRDDYAAYLEEIGFPDQGVIVRPLGVAGPIFKGIHRADQLSSAIAEALAASPRNCVALQPDLRANHSPRRRQAIQKAAQELLKKLASLCPCCGKPGFSPARAVTGLPCLGCGEETESVRSLVFQCLACSFEQVKGRPDGLTHAHPADCRFCSPY